MRFQSGKRAIFVGGRATENIFNHFGASRIAGTAREIAPLDSYIKFKLMDSSLQ